MEKLNYIVVDGLVKSGKTELSRIISEKFNSKLILDNKKNPFAENFFKSLAGDEKPEALKTQLIYLLNRFTQQMELSQRGLFYKTTVCNYLFYREGIYSHLVLNDDELEIYKRIYSIFSSNIIKPDLVVYLQLSFSEMIKRIKKYGSDQEKEVPNEFWRELFEAYNYYFFNYSLTPLLVINMERVNLSDPKDINNIISEIRNHKKGTKYYAP